jgi:hypothetical protein
MNRSEIQLNAITGITAKERTVVVQREEEIRDMWTMNVLSETSFSASSFSRLRDRDHNGPGMRMHLLLISFPSIVPECDLQNFLKRSFHTPDFILVTIETPLHHFFSPSAKAYTKGSLTQTGVPFAQFTPFFNAIS